MTDVCFNWSHGRWFSVWEAVLEVQCCASRERVFSSPITNNHPFNPLFAQRCQVINIFRWKNNWGLVEGHSCECDHLLCIELFIRAQIWYKNTYLLTCIYFLWYLKCISTDRVIDTLNEPLHGSLGDISSALYLNWLPVITFLWFHKRKLILVKPFDADVLEWSIWNMLTCWFSSAMFTFWPLYLYMRTCTGRYIFIWRTKYA